MKSRSNIKILLPLLVIFMTGSGQLAAQMGPGRGLCLSIDPSAPRFDQRRLQRPGQARTWRKQMPRRPMGDHQRMQDRINAMKMWKLTEYLSLSEEQAEKFFPRTREHQKEADEIFQQRRQLCDEFQKKIDAGEVSARDVDQYVAGIARLEKAQIDLRAKHIESLKDILTDEQRAKFAVFNEHFRKQLRYRLEEELVPPRAPQPEGEED